MKKLVAAIVAVAVVATIVNDAGRYLTALYDLDNITDAAARLAAEKAEAGGSRHVAGSAAVALAASGGARVWGYDQKTERVRVWAEMEVAGTWALAPYSAWRSGQPLDTPYVLRRESEAYIN